LNFSLRNFLEFEQKFVANISILHPGTLVFHELETELRYWNVHWGKTKASWLVKFTLVAGLAYFLALSAWDIATLPRTLIVIRVVPRVVIIVGFAVFARGLYAGDTDITWHRWGLPYLILGYFATHIFTKMSLVNALMQYGAIPEGARDDASRHGVNTVMQLPSDENNCYSELQIIAVKLVWLTTAFRPSFATAFLYFVVTAVMYFIPNLTLDLISQRGLEVFSIALITVTFTASSRRTEALSRLNFYIDSLVDDNQMAERLEAITIGRNSLTMNGSPPSKSSGRASVGSRASIGAPRVSLGSRMSKERNSFTSPEGAGLAITVNCAQS
jgi:cell division protein FtsW (lipid II flippase)